MATCTQCSSAFEIAPGETALYRDLDVSMPELCPACRRQRRIVFRNFFNLYHRTCSLTGKKIISMYRNDAPFPVYAIEEWWSDKWDPLSYGKEIDWNRPMFEQIGDLHRTVPRVAMVSMNCENSEYCNMAANTKNSYLVMGCVANEDCMYGHIVWKCKDAYDCLYCYQCERCYECIDCVQCNDLAYSRDCDNCSSSSFLVHCLGCRDCFGCVGLIKKQYCIFNEQHTKDAYEQKMRELNMGSRSTVAFAKSHVQNLIVQEIVKSYHGFDCESVTGDYLYHCRKVVEGYDLKNCEDVWHCGTADSMKNCQDCNFCGVPPLERCLQNVFVQGYEIAFCHGCFNNCSRMWYSDYCFSCQDCFACEGLRNKRFCILNSQYSKEEYEKLLPRLKEHMRQHGEWGSYFPPSLTPFGYNETIACEYFPMSREEALSKGWKWYEESDDAEQKYLGPEMTVPDDVRDASDDVTKAIFRCESSCQLYKILPQELRFYRQMNVPLPRKCFMERQRDRFALRNPRKLWNRHCAKCQASIQTTYAPDRPEIVYCEACYLSTVY
jgi:hypothetical protein